MDVLTTINVLLVAALTIVVAWLVVTLRRKGPDQTLQLQAMVDSLKAELVSRQMEGLVALRESLDTASRGLNERLAEGTTAMDRRLGVVTEIEHRLGQLQRQTQQIEEIGKNIQALSDLLKPPKLRGGLGELLLENLLGQILPTALFQMQYAFRDGARVDAVIRLGDRMLPVDSKFPLEAFERMQVSGENEQTDREFRKAIKGQIDSIAAKYLRPDEGTTDFAVMYIPSEAVYYRLVSDAGSELLAYALSKRVIPSSPGHLYAFLASVAAIYTEAGLAGNTRRLTAVLHALRESVEKLESAHERMAGSARMLSLNLDKARSETGEMQTQLESLRDGPEVAAETVTAIPKEEDR